MPQTKITNARELRNGIVKNEFDAVRNFLKTEGNTPAINEKNSENRTTMHYACLTTPADDLLAMLKLLSKHGGDPFARDIYEQTAYDCLQIFRTDLLPKTKAEIKKLFEASAPSNSSQAASSSAAYITRSLTPLSDIEIIPFPTLPTILFADKPPALGGKTETMSRVIFASKEKYPTCKKVLLYAMQAL